MFRRLFLFVAFGPLLTACSSGKTALHRGHFDLAVKNASHRLNQGAGLSKRGHPMATLVLKQAFERAYEQHQADIRQLPASGNRPAFGWEQVYREYEQFQTLTDNARRGFARLVGRPGAPERHPRRRSGTDSTCTSCAQWLAAYPASYADRQRDTRELAAADRYEAAEQAFAYRANPRREDNRLATKDAYLNYQKALEWVPDYRQARAKAEDALLFAILHVMVEPLSPTGEISPSENEELQGLIFKQISRNTAPS